MPHTSRGFEFIEFTDAYGEPCSIQVSSSAEPHIWLGCQKNSPPHHVTRKEMSPRMHLSRSQVLKLSEWLNRWLREGVFEDDDS